MKFDELGLPSDNGSSDKQDSARLAGIMTVFGWLQRVNLMFYINHAKQKYVRHPNEHIYDMSRDQSIPLIAGLFLQGHRFFVCREYIDGKDILSPSVMGHIRRCQGKKAHWWQDAWLYLDILWSAYADPKAELNQLLCVLIIAGPKWIERFKRHHKSWEKNLIDYWCGWRNEPELCDVMIKKIKEMAAR